MIQGLIKRLGYYSVILLAQVIVSCTTLNVIATDPVLESYQEEFAELTNSDIADMFLVTMTFRSLEPSIAGRCYYLTRQIYIEPKIWFKYSDLQKRELVFHELGHCVKLWKHDNRMIEGTGCAASLMSERIQPQKCLIKYWKLYIKDLKEKSL